MINEIKLNQSQGLKKLLKQGVVRPLEKAVFRIGTIGRNEVSKNIKKVGAIDKGQLRQSVIFRPLVDKTKGKISVGKKYGEYIEKGTGIYHADGARKPHFIKIPGVGVRFIQGFKPRPFFKPMVQNLKKEAPDIVKKEIDKYLKKIV